jgi:uncharacterized membrane protein YbhN (UPF0104 family)
MFNIFSLRGIFTIFFTLFIIIIITQIIDLNIIYHLIKESNQNYLFIGFALTLIWPVLAILKWSYTLKCLNLKIPFIKVLNSVMISLTTNIFAPAKSGDLIKMFVMGKKFKKLDLAAAVLSERLGDLFILLILSIVGSIYIDNLIYFYSSVTIFTIIILFIFVLNLININNDRNIIYKFLSIVIVSSKIWYTEFFNMLPVLVFSLTNWMLACFQIFLFFIAFGENINFFTILAIFPLTVLITLIPLTPGAIGVREASFILLFISYVDSNISATVSLCYFICSACITSLIGAIFTFFLNTRYQNKI